jgi:hypothetical protein
VHGHDIRLSDEPNDVVHVDMDGKCTCTDEELEALREYFKQVLRELPNRLS